MQAFMDAVNLEQRATLSLRFLLVVDVVGLR